MNAVEALLAEAERIVNDDLAPADIVDEIYTRQPDEQHAAAELVLRWADIVADDVDDPEALPEALRLLGIVLAAGREDVVDELDWIGELFDKRAKITS